MRAKGTEDFGALVHATDRLAYPTWILKGDVAFSARNASFTSTVVESPHDVESFRLRCADGTGALRRLSGGAWGRVTSALTAEAQDGSWKFTRGHVSEWNSGRAGNTATVAFHDFEQVRREGTPAVTVVVYANAPSSGIGWPLERMARTDEDRRAPLLGLRCRVFGREALIRAIEVPEFAPHGGTIAIAWVGGPFRGSALRVLLTVLSFVFGTFLEQVMRRTVDANGEVLRQTVYTVHSPKKRKPMPPIHLYQPWALAAVGDQFGTMLNRCRSLFAREVPLDVSVSHLLPPHDTIGGEIRDIALALDTLIESPLYTPRRRRLVARSRFQKIRADLEAFADSILGETEGEVKKRIGQVLQQANSASVNDRRKLFWDSLGMEPTAQELKALEHRDTMSHVGYIPFPHGREGAWNRLIREQHLLRTLVNRVIFRLLGYEGNVLNYVNGDDVTVSGVRAHRRRKPRGVSDKVRARANGRRSTTI
jgi:hypothetical protein